ncbi:hypothetical protein PCA31118_01186 [Pandoraea captiosa]|uniref:Uncharacterized protein n=1 Tax=Pandoraea captiosa TaxID=2508302 RepID=A0A5E4ZS46_9BURK|nr:hypothetical protein [Pandoraea captiosa]VVE63262.1 hypothetical protein PCA31118_01186 [Pandoraea captiosa]
MYSPSSTTGSAGGATNIPARLQPEDTSPKNCPPKTAEMAAELSTIGHSPVPSLAGLQIGRDAIVSTAENLRSATVRTETEDILPATERMKAAVREGVRNKQDVVAPPWFRELSEDAKRKVAKQVVDWVFSPVNNETERWFNRFTADKYIQKYLKNTVSETTYEEVGRLTCLRHVKERIKNYGMLEGQGNDIRPPLDRWSRAQRIENAKEEMWEALREAFRDRQSVAVPVSFHALHEEDKKEVVRLTVSWVFSPVDKHTHRWLECLVAGEGLRPYLKHTVPRETYDKAVRIGLNFVRETVDEYGMLVEEGGGHSRIKLAVGDLWRAVLDGVANRCDAKTPASFGGLSKAERRQVVQHTVARLLPVGSTKFEDHFNRLTANNDVKPFLKGTLLQSDADGISRKMENAGSQVLSNVMSRIYQYRMVAYRSEDPVEQARYDLWEAVLDGVSDDEEATTPASFRNLSSSDNKQAAVKGAVSRLKSLQAWQIKSHFDCLTANPDVEPYLKGSMTKTHYVAIESKLKYFTSIQIWREVTAKIEKYQMRG